jgi:Putative transposase
VSQRRARRPLVALFGVRRAADRLQLLPQPALSEVPKWCCPTLARSTAAGPLARAYYHVVFTVPAPISAIAYTNKEIIYGLLLDVATETLRTIAADPKHLGARIGTTLVLHTWGSALTHHPHVHGIVPGGGLAPDAERWVPCKPGFFLSVRVLSRLFRRRFLEELEKLHRDGQLQFFGEHVDLADTDAFSDWLISLRQREWVVYAKRPFSGPEQVLAYLSRYTHRVAISTRGS